MRKHLSVLALAARGTVCKVIAVTILAALLSGALLRLVPAYEDRVVYANDDGSVTSEYYPSDFSALPGKTGAAAVCAVGFAVLLAVLSLNGCGYGAKTGLTVGGCGSVRTSSACGGRCTTPCACCPTGR